MSETLKWNNSNFSLLTKNKVDVKANQGMTHSEPPLNRKMKKKK